MVEMCLNNRFNSFVDFSASDWYTKVQISFILKAPNSTFHKFLVFEPIAKPHNQHYLSLETPGQLKTNQENIWNISEKPYGCKYGNYLLRLVERLCTIF